MSHDTAQQSTLVTTFYTAVEKSHHTALYAAFETTKCSAFNETVTTTFRTAVMSAYIRTHQPYESANHATVFATIYTTVKPAHFAPLVAANSVTNDTAECAA